MILNSKVIKLQFKLPVSLIPHVFPHLYTFARQQLIAEYLRKNVAPVIVTVPREFICPDLNRDLELAAILHPERINLLNRINTAFGRNNFSYYDRYLFLLTRFAERSLLRLDVPSLKKLLLEITYVE